MYQELLSRPFFKTKIIDGEEISNEDRILMNRRIRELVSLSKNFEEQDHYYAFGSTYSFLYTFQEEINPFLDKLSIIENNLDVLNNKKTIERKKRLELAKHFPKDEYYDIQAIITKRSSLMYDEMRPEILFHILNQRIKNNCKISNFLLKIGDFKEQRFLESCVG